MPIIDRPTASLNLHLVDYNSTTSIWFSKFQCNIHESSSPISHNPSPCRHFGKSNLIKSHHDAS
jgi:hypothetical protein